MAKNYTLTVSDTTSEGWMVLCSDEEGRARLDMVSKVTGDTYFDLLKIIVKSLNGKVRERFNLFHRQ